MLRGVQGIVVVIEADVDRRKWTVASGGDGKFLFPRLPDGRYSVSVDADSLPAGYLIDEPSTVHVVTASGLAPRANLKIRALRNVSGRVVLYDRILGKYVGIPSVTVVVAELGLRTTTDREGRFLFRGLSSGNFAVSAEYRGQIINQLVTVPEEPTQLTNVDLVMGQQ
jgi:hypothetical protein